MKPTFSDAMYQFAHGRKPSGNGRWVFFFDNDATCYIYEGTFSQAKAKAMARAKRWGVFEVRLGS